MYQSLEMEYGAISTILTDDLNILNVMYSNDVQLIEKELLKNFRDQNNI